MACVLGAEGWTHSQEQRPPQKANLCQVPTNVEYVCLKEDLCER